MKKCPKCNAEIDENANFCIYCMTSFVEKEAIVFPKRRMKKKTITVIALALVIAVVFAFTPFFGGNDSMETANTTMIVDTPSPTPFVIVETAAPTVSFTVIPTHTLTVAPTQTITKRPTKQPTTKPAATTSPTATTLPNVTTSPTVTPTISIEPSIMPTQVITQQPTTKPTETTTATTDTKGKYIFRYSDALPPNQYYDDYSNWDDDNAVYVMGIVQDQRPSNGVYEVPAYIDGNEVIGFGWSTFTLPEYKATAIILPETLQSIDFYTFPYIYNTFSFYIKSDRVRIIGKDKWASNFAGKVTVYCSAECRIQDGVLFKDFLEQAGINYVEWNG